MATYTGNRYDSTDKPQWTTVDIKHSTDTSVHKFIYTKDDAIAESVLYAYPTFEERTVMCVSTMTGCPMGCTFCGTGKFFGRNLTAEEIIEQIERMKVEYDIDFSKVQRLQLMFMSMGEPILNLGMSEVYRFLTEEYPNAQLLVSTSGPKTDVGWESFMNDATFYHGIGLQFSVHESTDDARNKLIPMKAKLSLEEISMKGLEFFLATGRKPFFNYCVHPLNDTDEDIMRLRMLFDPRVWECTLSVICESDSNMADTTDAQMPMIRSFDERMIKQGYNTRIFNPAGTDDIGGGCGQLHQVQKFAAKNPHIMKQSPGNKIHVKNITCEPKRKLIAIDAYADFGPKQVWGIQVIDNMPMFLNYLHQSWDFYTTTLSHDEVNAAITDFIESSDETTTDIEEFDIDVDADDYVKYTNAMIEKAKRFFGE